MQICTCTKIFSDFQIFEIFQNFFPIFFFDIFWSRELLIVSLEQGKNFPQNRSRRVQQIPLSRKLNFSSVTSLLCTADIIRSLICVFNTWERFLSTPSSKLIFQIVHFTFFFGLGIHNQTPAVVERKGGTNRRSEGWISVDRRWSYSQTYNTLS